MNIVYFDTIAGISGDMTLGAFVNAGLSIEELSTELEKLNISGFELQASHIERSSIVATKVEVLISDQPHYHRHLKDINAIIDNSSLSEVVKQTAKKIFMEVAIAEAKVHNSTPEKIHFHEVGALDSIIDIVGAAICLDKFHIEAVYSSPVRTGNGGFVNTQHGKMPIPTPATMEILRGYPTELTDIPFELTTPTGAAIIKALSRGMLNTEHFNVASIGYGAGKRGLEQTPNLLRVLIGALEAAYQHDELVSVETNIDDMNPEMYPYVMEQLMNAGAHDAYLVPIIMKKGRPGIILSVMVERSKLDALMEVLFRETSTLGARVQPIERHKLARTQKQVHSSLGVVTVKSIVRDGKERLVPEFEECKRIAIEKKMPLLEVYQILERELAG